MEDRFAKRGRGRLPLDAVGRVAAGERPERPIPPRPAVFRCIGRGAATIKDRDLGSVVHDNPAAIAPAGPGGLTAPKCSANTKPAPKKFSKQLLGVQPPLR